MNDLRQTSTCSKVPTREALCEIQNIKVRLESINLSKTYEKIYLLNKRKEKLLEEFDWFDKTFEKNGKYGLKDCFGTLLIPASYEEVWLRPDYFTSREKPIACKKEENWGMVLPDGKGTVIIDFKYEEIIMNDYYSTWGLLIVKEDEKFGIIDLKDNVLAKPELDEIFEQKNDAGLVRKDNKYGFIYYDGTYIQPLYDMISFSISDVYYHVKFEGCWGFIDRELGFIDAQAFNEARSHLYFKSII